MFAKYFSIIRNCVLSVLSQRKYKFYHQNTLLDAFRTNSRNIIGGNPSMVIPLLANQDLTPMFVLTYTWCGTHSKSIKINGIAVIFEQLHTTIDTHVFLKECLIVW